MPAKSEKQEKFMRAVAHSPSFAKKVGVPMSVGREFTKSGGGMPLKFESDLYATVLARVLSQNFANHITSRADSWGFIRAIKIWQLV